MNRLKEVLSLGQSIWLDNIHRGLLQSGELKTLIENGLRGLTSNPSIFEKAIAGGKFYDEAIRTLIQDGKSVEEIFDCLAVEDIQGAADLFRPVYDESNGADGYVSLEVPPSLARDTEGTVREARRLWGLVRRSNVMIKIPATQEGLPAIRRCLSEGIPVNVTLIFSIERYRDVMDAYGAALNDRLKAGQSLAIASVASFFISRLDVAVDKELELKMNQAKTARDKEDFRALLGKTAVANARVAYATHQKTFQGPNWEILRGKGARVQRPLWASTGTKNPLYSDLLYVEELIGMNTVNTLPPATLDAFCSRGKTADTLASKNSESQKVLETLNALGVDLAQITNQLETDGLRLFSDAYIALMSGLRMRKNLISKT